MSLKTKTLKFAKKYPWLLLLVPFISIATLLLIGIVHYGVNTPFWDEWEMVPLFQKVDEHKLNFTDVWQQHNEHRILFPNLVLTMLAYATKWNIRAELLLNFAISLITSLMLYLFVLSRVRRRSLAFLLAILVAAWFFSPVQFENWLWGWQIEWFLAIAGIVGTIFWLDRDANSKKPSFWMFALAILSAFVATFSLGSGILAWAIGFVVLWLHRQPRKRLIWWLVSSLLATGIYYKSYHKPAGSPPINVFLHHPSQFLQYIAAYIGRPVSGNQSTAILIGCILILTTIPLIYIVLVRNKDLQKFIPWLCLMILPLFAGVITAVSRLGLGLDQSLASRYTGFSLLFYIGAIGLVISLIDTQKLKQSSLIFIILAVIAVNLPLLVSSYSNGRTGFKDRSLFLNTLKHCTAETKPSESCLISTYPSSEIAQERLNYLREKGWAGY